MKRWPLALPLLMLVLSVPILARDQAPPPSGAAAQSQPPASGKPTAADRMFFGGGIGFGFGDVEWVEVSPMVGIRLMPDLATGIGLTYRTMNDSRSGQDLKTSDFGGDVFAQYTVFRNIFAMAEYEYLNYQYYDVNFEKVSDSFNSVYVGGGAFQPMGGHASLVFSALYNLSYSADKPSPYGSPWLFSAGVSVGF